MSPQSDEAKAQERLSQIRAETAEMEERLQATLKIFRDLGEQFLKSARDSREANEALADLRAEARYLCLLHGFEVVDNPGPHKHLEVVQDLWHDVSTNLKPAIPSEEWVEKIRSATLTQNSQSVLTDEESAELRKRLEETVCPLCVNFALDGTCTLEAFDECPITSYQDRVVLMIQRMGHSPWMEDYFQQMYQNICPLCRDRSSGDVCVPREEGDCALFSYLPSIVKTVEEFMREKAENQPSAG